MREDTARGPMVSPRARFQDAKEIEVFVATLTFPRVPEAWNMACYGLMVSAPSPVNENPEVAFAFTPPAITLPSFTKTMP